jgi:hypothetical protein
MMGDTATLVLSLPKLEAEIAALGSKIDAQSAEIHAMREELARITAFLGVPGPAATIDIGPSTVEDKETS